MTLLCSAHHAVKTKLRRTPPAAACSVFTWARPNVDLLASKLDSDAWTRYASMRALAWTDRAYPQRIAIVPAARQRGPDKIHS